MHKEQKAKLFILLCCTKKAPFSKADSRRFLPEDQCASSSEHELSLKTKQSGRIWIIKRDASPFSTIEGDLSHYRR